MTRFILFLMWLLHWLPLPLLAGVGRGLGRVLYLLVGERRHVTLTNLGRCFPQLPPAEKSALARRHLMAFGRSILELGLWWHASPARIRRLVRLDGIEKLDALGARPVILLAPHFVSIDAGWIRLAVDRPMVSMYTQQKNRVFAAALNRGRLRFGNSQLASRQEGTRKAVKAMKQGHPFYYAPDMDYGRKDSVFVPFFGVQTATITGLARLARMTGATVVPVITRMAPGGYVVTVGEPWSDFPGDDDMADARRMNAFIEVEIAKSPEQYYWLHKRFKTRPPGEKGFYSKKHQR